MFVDESKTPNWKLARWNTFYQNQKHAIRKSPYYDQTTYKFI